MVPVSAKVPAPPNMVSAPVPLTLPETLMVVPPLTLMLPPAAPRTKLRAVEIGPSVASEPPLRVTDPRVVVEPKLLSALMATSAPPLMVMGPVSPELVPVSRSVCPPPKMVRPLEPVMAVEIADVPVPPT